jgi:hypothetical protein
LTYNTAEREAYLENKRLELERAAHELHLLEHPEDDVNECTVDWHKGDWFKHIAEGHQSHSGGV